jgi:hypothetical protein
MIDRHPDAVVRCAGVADARAAVNFAPQERLTVVIRGGGHNGARLGVCDHALVIDLSLMKGVRVDPAQTRCELRQVAPRPITAFEGVSEQVEDFWRPELFEPSPPDIQTLVVLFEDYDFPPADADAEDISIVAQ